MLTAAFAYNNNNWKQMSMNQRVQLEQWYLSAHRVLIGKAVYDILSGKSKLKDQYTDNSVYRKKAKLSTCGDTERGWQTTPSGDATNSGVGIGQRGGTDGTVFFFFFFLQASVVFESPTIIMGGPWRTHVDAWQKPTQFCKAVILQLKDK